MKQMRNYSHLSLLAEVKFQDPLWEVEIREYFTPTPPKQKVLVFLVSFIYKHLNVFFSHLTTF